ncbi:MAG: ParA family protein [Candidatus Krumholzibacteriota bacterium]|nr:ParA family protein [Candidatus Krumholzibacteriota bacterium]
MKKYAIMTMKGGTGKTTTGVNLAHGLALSGKKVLLIDCDPQRNTSITFGNQGKRGLSSLLRTGDVDIMLVRDNLFLIDSGGKDLMEVELLLGSQQNRERRMSKALSNLKGPDFVICDCPPSLNLININVLAFSNEVIVPVSLDHLSKVGLTQTIEMIDEVKWHAPKRTINFIVLPTFFDSRTNISKIVLEEIRSKYSENIFKTVIRVNTALREAPGFNKTIYEHAPLSRGAFDYYRLTEEILNI